MINILESSAVLSNSHRQRYRLRIEGIPDSIDKVELRGLLLGRCKSVGSLEIERTQSQDTSVLRTAFVSVTEPADRDLLVSEGFYVDGRKLPVEMIDSECDQQKEECNLRKVFVTSIPFGSTDISLMKFFNKFGPCEPDVIGRVSPSGKELTFCTITFQDCSTARMLIAKKTLDFNGKKLKILKYEVSAEGKLDHLKEPMSAKRRKKSSPNTRRKGSMQNESETTPLQPRCQLCLSKPYITKCACLESPASKGIGTDSRPDVSTQDSAGVAHNTHLKSPLKSPEHVKGPSTIARLNLLDHLMDTGLFSKQDLPDSKFQRDKFVRTTPANARNEPKAPRSMYAGEHKSRSMSRRRFASEEVDLNHYENNLRFNKTKPDQEFQNLNPLHH